MGSEQQRTKVTREMKVAEAEISLWSERFVDVVFLSGTHIAVFVFVVNCMLISLQGIAPTTFSIHTAPKLPRSS